MKAPFRHRTGPQQRRKFADSWGMRATLRSIAVALGITLAMPLTACGADEPKIFGTFRAIDEVNKRHGSCNASEPEIDGEIRVRNENGEVIGIATIEAGVWKNVESVGSQCDMQFTTKTVEKSIEYLVYVNDDEYTRFAHDSDSVEGGIVIERLWIDAEDD
jgi:hypothetical protein